MPGRTSVGLLQRAQTAVEGKQWGTAVDLYTQILMERDVVEESGGESSEGGELSARLRSVPECSKAMILISRAAAYLKIREFKRCIEGFEMDANTFPDIVRAIMVGDIQGVREAWRRAEHLKLRMTRLKIPLIHFPVIGRQRITPKVSVEEYCDVVDFLFEEGCRLDHRDRVGYTAIMHGCGPEGEHGIIQHMLKKGADPNIQSSYGTTALHDAVQSQHTDIVDTLLQHGADPSIPDNNGTTPYQRGQQFRELIAVLDRQTSSNTVEKQCNNCSSRCGVSRCAKCRFVCYCSKECQVAHWPSHKKQCKHIQRSHMRLKALPTDDPDEISSLISNLSESSLEKQCNPQAKPQKPDAKLYETEAMDNFNKAWIRDENILKLQVCTAMVSDGHQGQDKILACNRSKDLMLRLSSTELDGARMAGFLSEKGLKGEEGNAGYCKGYFLGFSDVPGEIVLITEPMLPDQSW